MKKKYFCNYLKGGIISIFLLISTFVGFAQNITVQGTVTDKTGETIIGATIIVESNTSIGTTTDLDGNYTLSNVPSDANLIFSYVGMKTQTVAVNGRATIDVVLESDSELLDELVVVGYGSQKKVNLTGTVNTISAKDIVGKPVTSLANAMQGTLPGVTIISRPGDLGNDMGSINIRGRGNLGSASPLYIVDGVPVSEGDFMRIHPGDVESISILKDAAASAIYGSRAAFGVFLVTTKKGKEGKASISYNGYFALQSPTVLPNKLNSSDYATLINEANRNAGKDIVYNDEAMRMINSGSNPDLYPNNDWYDMVYRDYAPMQEHNISVSGGGQTRYFVSGTFYEQNSLIPDRKLDRYSFRTNTERDFSDKFRLGTTISFVKDDWSREGDFSITDLDRMTPLTVGRHSDGTWGTVTGGKQSGVLAENNPLRKMAEFGRSNTQTSRFNGNVNATFKPIEGLEINGVLSYNKYDHNKSVFENRVPKLIGFIDKTEMTGTEKNLNNLDNSWVTSNTFMSQFFATYSKSIGLNDFSAMIGTQYEAYEVKSLGASRKDFPSNTLDVIDAGSGKAENLGNSGSIGEKAFLSQFGRFNYSYASKYLFEANVRFDQSSQFPSDNRLGVFPSFSGAWRISEEAFMEDYDWLDNLKLRGSWGTLGNVSNVGYYDYMDVLAIGSAYVTNEAKQDGVWPSKQPNKNLSWEKVAMTNIGVDATFLNNKLNVQLDLFNKVTSDILLKMPQPFELGVSGDESVSSNAGEVTNKGIEFLASYRDNIGDFNYEISGNFSKIWNEVTDLNGLDDQISGVWIHRIGEPIGAFYGYKALGLFVDEADVNNHVQQDAQTKPGDIKYADVNGDGVFNADDRTILGNDVPYFTYGVNLSASYKGFDFAIQGQGVNDVKVYLSGETSQAFFNGASAKEFHLGRWTSENPNANANYPRLLPTADNNHNSRTSSFWLFDADYFRIKNLTFGYTLPNQLTQKVGVESLRLYLSGTNMFTLRADKRMKDFDPEMASARGTYPNLKVMSFGLNLTF